ncbi:uncharacterized protein EV422DRAFT_526613 [Fimicolochytrium jonesii]|uniref:uncharacterized protein n=1 Tax=Fimicolochytrium jonesii TaxID=1396493 RepID=UPI0022FE2367|nr:uncharacterized protein EV422DRAFT_526613 [Fimicolochytrium jonesii]KAI8821701.1 hypothetical protein EV422DRAFT_526613 [Fimicolochytrium jonesii]
MPPPSQTKHTPTSISTHTPQQPHPSTTSPARIHPFRPIHRTPTTPHSQPPSSRPHPIHQQTRSPQQQPHHPKRKRARKSMRRPRRRSRRGTIPRCGNHRASRLQQHWNRYHSPPRRSENPPRHPSPRARRTSENGCTNQQARRGQRGSRRRRCLRGGKGPGRGGRGRGLLVERVWAGVEPGIISYPTYLLGGFIFIPVYLFDIFPNFCTYGLSCGRR